MKESKEIERETGYKIDIVAILVRDTLKKRMATPGTKITGDIQEVFVRSIHRCCF